MQPCKTLGARPDDTSSYTYLDHKIKTKHVESSSSTQCRWGRVDVAWISDLQLPPTPYARQLQPATPGLLACVSTGRLGGSSTRSASRRRPCTSVWLPCRYPRGRPRADLHPKKVCNLGPMSSVPVKNVNYPRGARNRNSGLVGPHTTPTIVNYKYMASTPREGYFGLPTPGT